MAVANPGLPNYGGAYESIANTISQSGARQAAMESRRGPSPMGAAAITLGNVYGDLAQKKAQEQKEAKMLRLKADLEDHLEKNKIKYTAAGEGKIEVDQPMLDDLSKQMGLKESVKLPTDDKGKPITLLMTPAQIQENAATFKKRVAVRNLADSVRDEDSKLADYIDAFPEEGKTVAEKMFPSSFGQPITEKNPASSTGYTYSFRDKAGNITKTEMEAPDPTKKSVPASQTPDAKTERRRKEFQTRIDKEVSYSNIEGAYSNALLAKHNKSIAADVGLVYALARARDPNGKLSDKDVTEAYKAGDLEQDLMLKINKVLGGQLLEDDVREDMINEVKKKYDTSEANLKRLEKTYTDISKKEGLDSTSIVTQQRTKRVQAIEYLAEKKMKVNETNISKVVDYLASEKE